MRQPMGNADGGITGLSLTGGGHQPIGDQGGGGGNGGGTLVHAPLLKTWRDNKVQALNPKP